MKLSSSPSVAPHEIDRFSRQAADWWSPDGPFRALHELGPLRMDYIARMIDAHAAPPQAARRKKAPRTVLDVGCGGGLMAEALARAGYAVTGIDASGAAIDVARAHAAANGLAIDYRVATAEALAGAGEAYDVVTALEIVEHVADLSSFMRAVSALVKPGGLLIVATLNRTKRSFLLSVVVAEYLLGWVEPGTHDWDKFVKPSELAVLWEGGSIRPVDVTGMVYRPFDRTFSLAKGRAGVNYFMTGKKEKGL